MAIFTYTTGTTGGFYVTPFMVGSTTDLTSLANGGSTTLGGGTAYTQGSFSAGLWGYVIIKFAATNWTATSGGSIQGWFAKSYDGGTNYETLTATSSATVAALPRTPDFIVPLDAGNMSNAVKWSGIVNIPNAQTKIVIQGLAGATIGTGSHTVFVAPFAIQAV